MERRKKMKTKLKKSTPKTFVASDSIDFESAVDNGHESVKKWFEEVSDDPKDFKPVTEQILIELKDEAKKCNDSEVASYNIKNARTNSDFKWMKTIMSKGTVSDKVAAHTVAIQDNPVCSLETIRNLVNMVKVGKKKECTIVIDVLTELFLSDLLRPDQKLKAFHQRPLSLLNELSSGNSVTRRKLLSIWYFEDQLKEIYTSFVLALNIVSHDTIDNNKEKAIGSMYKLLAGNPEQEKNLLSYLVNKLGDPSQKVASKAIYTLGQLLFKHPNMQGVVLNEVERLLFRPNVSTKTQYYGLCFLSQFYLSHEASDVARRLIEVYFSFFKACIKKGEVDSRMMSALLMGVNRAYPYAKLEMDKVSEHIDTMYRVVHVANFNISIHALTLLYQVSDYGNNISNRFYSALYKKLIDPNLFKTTHQALLLSLIYKALLKDTELARIKTFVKRLLQLSLFMQPSFACGVLYLVSQLMGKKANVQALQLKQSFDSNMEDDDDDEEEKYHDVKDETENIVVEQEEEQDDEDVKPDVEVLNESVAGPSWYHCKNTSKKDTNAPPQQYTPLSRNPLYAGGDLCVYAELNILRNHFHPTVSLYATNLLKGKVINYSGDPLKDFTLIKFLDRFVFRNPKKPEDVSKQGAHPTFGKRKVYRPKGLRSLAVNSEAYLRENQKNIPVDELFLHTYLQQKYQEKQSNKENDDDHSDLESVQDDEFEEMLDKMVGAPVENEELDFMNDIGDTFKSKKTKKNKRQDDEEPENADPLDESMSEDEIDDDDSDVGEDDLEINEDDLEMDEDDEELLNDIDDDEDEDIVFDDSDSEDKFRSKKRKKTNKLDSDVMSLFASAEEFASLLEDEGGSKIAPGGSNAFANKDKADVKQIAWEDKRNRWLQGFDKAIGKAKKNGKPSGKKRPGQSTFSKNKKFKK